MKKIKFFVLLFSLLLGFSMNAQSNKWSLERCVAFAIDHNLSIKQAALDLKLTEIDKVVAKANFIPSVNANSSHSWNIGLNQDVTTGLLRNQTTQYSSFGVNFGFDIYKGLQNHTSLRKANMMLLASKYKLVKMQEDVALNVANAYLQVLFNKENLKLKLAQKDLDEKQLTRSEDLVKIGTLPSGDLLDYKATIASDFQKVVEVENALLISKLSLIQLLQYESVDDFDVVEEDFIMVENAMVKELPEVIFSKAATLRTEIKWAINNMDIAKNNVVIAKSDLQPRLSGFYAVNSRISYADRFDYQSGTSQAALPFGQQFFDNKGQAFGVQATIPIFNGWSVKSNVERSKVNVLKAKLALEQEEATLKRNVYVAYTDAKGSFNLYQSGLVAVQARQKAYQYATEKYALGMTNAFDVNQVQALLANAQTELLKAKYDYIFKVKILEFYFGVPVFKK